MYYYCEIIVRFMNGKTIKPAKEKNGKVLPLRSVRLAPFIDNKVCALLKDDYRKRDSGESLYGGKFSAYIKELIRCDLKSKGLL